LRVLGNGLGFNRGVTSLKISFTPMSDEGITGMLFGASASESQARKQTPPLSPHPSQPPPLPSMHTFLHSGMGGNETLKTLCIHRCRLGPGAAPALCDFGSRALLSQLDLEGNLLGVDGLGQLAPLFANTETLDTIALKENGIDVMEAGEEAMCAAMAIVCDSLLRVSGFASGRGVERRCSLLGTGVVLFSFLFPQVLTPALASPPVRPAHWGI
jgi:hypothetical protein